MKKQIVGVLIVAGFTFGATAPAFAGSCDGYGDEPKAKCNSGRGNLSESTPANDCDPGNSGGHNRGGD